MNTQVSRLKTLLVSLSLGLLGLAATPFSITFTVGEASIGFVWARFFPMISALAFGPLAGLVSGLVGGSWFPFILWPSNGWANVLSSLDSMLFFCLIGFASGKRFQTLMFKKPLPGIGPYTPHVLPAAIALYLVLRWGVFLLLFNRLLALNPPFWLTQADTAFTLEVLVSILVKHTITTLLLVLTAGIALRLNPIRRFLGMPVQKEMNRNHIILCFTCLVAMGIWLLLLVLRKLFLGLPPELIKDFILITIIAVYSGWVVALRIVFIFVESAQIAQDRLKKAEHQFRLIGEQANDLISILDATGKCLYVSPSVRHILGYAPEQYLNGYPMETVHPEDRGILEEYQDSVKNGKDPGSPHLTYRARTGEGNWVWLESVPQTIHDGDEPGNRILIISRDVTQRKQDQELITKALAEKEVLLRELYHRTKNNMQTIISMLYLKSSGREDPGIQSLVQDIHNKITAMAEIHDRLYKSKDLTRVEMEEYIRGFCQLTVQGFQAIPGQVEISINSQQAYLPVDQALPCGLILSELLTNSFKYAFPKQKTGTITIDFIQEPKLNTLTYRDSGPGLPTAEPASTNERLKSSGMGLHIIHNLVTSQLKGSIELQNPPGFTAIISFPRLPL